MTPTPATKVPANRLCRATTKAGKPCKNPKSTDSSYCFFHNPDKATERKAAQISGGHNRANKPPPMPPGTPDLDLKSAEDVRQLMSQTISQLRRGEMERATCSTIGYLSQVVLKSIEQGEFESRLDNIERELSLKKDG